MIKAAWSRARRLVGMVLLLAGLTLASGAQAAPGRRAVAPGRVVLPVNGGIPVSSISGARASRVVALPGGGAILVGGGFPGGKGFYAAALTSTGSLDPSFGSRGIAGVKVGRRVVPLQLLGQPDGKLVVVASSGSAGRVVIVRLNADGGVDQGFGSGGVAVTPVATVCGSCTTGALTPDGGIMVTGEPLGAGPSWVVTRLTGSGAVDQAFGHEGTVPISGAGTSGYDVAVLGDGSIVTLGVTRLKAVRTSLAMLTRLRPDGLPDRDFNGGTPAELPSGSGASAMLVYPDGSVLVGGGSGLFRYTSVGAPDAGFGTAGVLRIGSLPSPVQLVPAAGGATLVVGPSAGSAGSLRAVLVTAAGGLDQSLGGSTGVVYRPLFGGGTASTGSGGQAALAQDSFVAGGLALRADGSYLAVGGVSVSQPPGRGGGRSIFDFAAAAVTPSFRSDGEFGGRARRLTVGLRIARQSAGIALSDHAIAVRLDASAPGLGRVTIRAHGRVIASSVVAILGSGGRDVAIRLTAYGSAVLGSERGVQLTADAKARDLLGATARGSASGTLR